MWVIADYEASSLFSLKSSAATSSAGKTLLVPTPFALKMALLDVDIRTRGLAQGKQDFEWLRDLEIAIVPAPRAIVTNLFAKIQKPRRTDDEKKEAKAKREAAVEETTDEGGEVMGSGPFGPTIAYREYVHLQGRLSFGFSPRPNIDEATALEVLPQLLVQLNYLGKRGGFFQMLELAQKVKYLPTNFVPLTNQDKIFMGEILQQLDDCGPELTFEKADIYSDKKIKLTKERVLRPIVLPYALKQSSRSYSYYERIEE